MEYYSVVKNNDILKFACKWMELEKAILNEVTPTQKDKHGMPSLISGYNQTTNHNPREASLKGEP